VTFKSFVNKYLLHNAHADLDEPMTYNVYKSTGRCLISTGLYAFQFNSIQFMLHIQYINMVTLYCNKNTAALCWNIPCYCKPWILTKKCCWNCWFVNE